MNALPADPELDTLLAFNHQVLAQALDLVQAHRARPGAAYAGPVGAHLRHLIEHHEALLSTPAGDVIDYDRRPRDRQLETDPAEAAQRLQALLLQLAERAGHPDRALQVRGQSGLDGSASFSVRSSLGRELAFVASHAVHHFALLLPDARRLGLPLPADFGLAPATIAHQRSTAAADPSTLRIQESACSPLPQAA